MKKTVLSALTFSMIVMATTVPAQETPAIATTTTAPEITTTTTAQETPEIRHRIFHLSLVTPLGTNGKHSNLTTNNVSFNILMGKSYGNNGVEFAGFANVIENDVNGVQFAGAANIVKNNLTGGQFAGVVNTAKDMKGAQFAAVNAAKDVGGLQIGVVNIAKKVKGFQLGVFNYAEELDGAALGVISIVKNGGKREFEVSFSEALNTAVSFKLGTDRLYTIFSGGAKFLPTDSREYAVGMGLGTHFDWAKEGWGNQIEGIWYRITEDEKFTSGFSQLIQYKFTVSKEFAKHLKVFAGSVVNITHSQYKDPKTGKIGSDFAPYSQWENNSGKTHSNVWVGFTLGVRF